MSKRRRSPVELYHDRVAGIYDTIYDGDPYWEAVCEITWNHLRRFLPRAQGSRCLDLGCGTGRWGLRLLKSGFPVDFLDISRKMLDQVAAKLVRAGRRVVECDGMRADPVSGRAAAPSPPPAGSLLVHASVDDMSMLPAQSYDLIVGQGDPLGCARRPERTLKELTRLLRPGGVMVMSVDHRWAGIYHFFKAGDVSGLERFARDGRTRWVTDAVEERFPITMFTPTQIRKLCAVRDLELLSLIGKTVLPLRRFKELLRDRDTRARLLRLEQRLHATEALFAAATHLEFAARKKKDEGDESDKHGKNGKR